MKVVNGNVEFISCEIHAWEHAEGTTTTLLVVKETWGYSCLLKLASFDSDNF